MGKKKEQEITLPSLDELFSSQKTRDDAKTRKIVNIPVEEIDDFPNHPFQIREDEDMIHLLESIKENGIITPALVRRTENGRYQMISGHRRKHILKCLGIQEMPCEIVDIDLDTAIIKMVDSNVQRTELLPSERAFSYHMRLEAMKRQGARTDITSVQIAQKSKKGIVSRELLAKEIGVQQDTIRRYIRLTKLIPEILLLVDEKRIGITIGVDISFLPENLQKTLYDAIELEVCTPSGGQAKRMKSMSDEGKLTEALIYEIMQEEKPNQKERIVLRNSRIQELIPKNVAVAKREEYIIKALEHYAKHRRKEMTR